MRAIIAGMVLAALLVPSLGSASPMRYDVNATFFNGGSLSGYFMYDVSAGGEQSGEYSLLLERVSSFSLSGMTPSANNGFNFAAVQEFGFNYVSLQFSFDLFNCLPGSNCADLPFGQVTVSDFTPGFFSSPDTPLFSTLSVTRSAVV